MRSPDTSNLNANCIGHVATRISSAESGICTVGCQHGRGFIKERCVRGGLEVRRFRLNHAHVNVAGSIEVVLVQQRVLKRGAVHPDRSLRLYEKASRIVDVDLVIVVQIVVSYPTCSRNPARQIGCSIISTAHVHTPHILQISGSLGGNTHEAPGACTGLRRGRAAVTARTVGGADLGTNGSSNAEVHLNAAFSSVASK
jgi:hypothetical protein